MHSGLASWLGIRRGWLSVLSVLNPPEDGQPGFYRFFWLFHQRMSPANEVQVRQVAKGVSSRVRRYVQFIYTTQLSASSLTWVEISLSMPCHHHLATLTCSLGRDRARHQRSKLQVTAPGPILCHRHSLSTILMFPQRKRGRRQRSVAPALGFRA